MATEQEEVHEVARLPCPFCNSRDNRALYSDGHTYCYSCPEEDAWQPAEGEEAPKVKPSGGKKVLGLITDGEVNGLRARKISQETCQKFGYQTGQFEGKPVQIAPYYDADRRLVAQKIRFANKDFKVLGSLKEALPFGAQAWPKTGRKIVVTEGEIDALSMSQVQSNKYPVVSIGCGAGGQVRRYMARHADYFAGFEEVVLMFDMDDPGRRAAEEAARVLGARARIAELPEGYKDANEMLVAGKVKELLDAMWRAKPYRPEGIVDMADLKDIAKERPRLGLSWCFPTLTKLTYGKRIGELYAVGAGTGVGKTDFLTQDMVHMVREHGQKIGIFSLEQSPAETVLRLVGKNARRPLHIPDEWDGAIYEESWASLVKERSVFLYDSFGINQWDAIEGRIRFLHHVEGVQWFYFDHLTAVAAAEEDERKGLERIMAEMGGLVKEIPISIVFVSHLATPEGKPHEEGGRVMIRHFKGSRSIGFWSHYMFGLERNQQADDPVERTTTTFRILKDRHTGRATGQTFFLGYDPKEGMLFEKEAGAEEYGFAEEDFSTGQGGDF